MRKQLGERISHYRELRNLSQSALASAIGVDKNTVWRWEDGRSWPEYDKLTAIADALKINPERLFETIGKVAPKDIVSGKKELLGTLLEEALKLDNDSLSLVLESIRVRTKSRQGQPVSRIKDDK